MARTYTPIWEQLKRDGIVIVKAVPSLHKRIIKAVSKEKYLDEEFRETGNTKIFHTAEGEHITFRLKDYRSISIILAEQRRLSLESHNS